MWKKIIRELKMHGNKAFMDFLRKILQDETDERKVEEQARKMALKKPEKTKEGYLLVDFVEEKTDGRYSSEKISGTTSGRKEREEPYRTFDKMRQIGKKPGKYADWYVSDTTSFIKQAEFMRDFTDNSEHFVPLEVYYPAYDKMDDSQLRTYFTWRTEARNGNIKDVSVAYVYCYIYELLNGIGVDTPENGIEKLISLWTEFRKFNNSLDINMRNWIRDYYIVHNKEISNSFTVYRDKIPINYHEFDINLYSFALTFKWENLRAVELFSSFNITDGQFYKSGDKEIVEKCACFVLKEISKYFKESGTDFKKLFLAKKRDEIYSFFRGAIHSPVYFYDTVVELDEIETYKFNGRKYRIESPDISKYRVVVGYILKLMEVNLRKLFGSKKSLQPPAIKAVEKCFFENARNYRWYSLSGDFSDLSVWKRKMLETLYDDSFEDVIIRSISKYFKQSNIVIKNGKIEIIKPVEIDMSKLKAIEKAHIETAKKLILEEEPVEAESFNEIISNNTAKTIDEKVEEEKTDVTDTEPSGFAKVFSLLSDEGQALLLNLVKEEAFGSNFELLVEEINEKSLEVTGDNLIEYISGEPRIYEEYFDEVKEELGGR
jgi:hypothetical protein